MKYTVHLQEQDQHDALGLHLRLRAAFRRILWGLAGVAVLGAGYVLYRGLGEGVWEKDFILVLGIVGVFAFFLRRNLRQAVAKNWQQQKALHQPYTFELSDEGYFVDAANGTMRMPWSNVHGWRSNDRILLLYQSDLLYNALPWRVVTDPTEKEKVLRLIESKLGAQKR